MFLHSSVCCGLFYFIFIYFYYFFWFNFFLNQFNSCFPLCSIHYHNPRQKEIKNQTGLKIFEIKKILNHNIYQPH